MRQATPSRQIGVLTFSPQLCRLLFTSRRDKRTFAYIKGLRHSIFKLLTVYFVYSMWHCCGMTSALMRSSLAGHPFYTRSNFKRNIKTNLATTATMTNSYLIARDCECQRESSLFGYDGRSESSPLSNPSPQRLAK